MSDDRFSELLFIHVSKVNREGDEPSFHYSLMNTGQNIHNWSSDKNQFRHCYHDIEAGKYYIIQQECYEFPRKKRWVWEQCIEVPTKGLLNAAYDIWKKTHDIERVLVDSGIKSYTQQKRKRQQLWQAMGVE